MSAIHQIKNWFEQAMPVVTPDNQRVQTGVHVEEFAEMIETLGFEGSPVQQDMLFENTHAVVNRFGTILKQNKDHILISKDRKELLDSLCDQVVTAIGTAHVFGFDILGALKEVADSNDSKFVDGKPIWNEHGKIAKGPNYFRAKLDPFIGVDPTTI